MALFVGLFLWTDIRAKYHCAQNLSFNSRSGRTKPDLVAPGHWVMSASANLREFGECDGSGGLHWESGTSMSAPVVSGSSALVRQYFEDGYYPCGSLGCNESLSPSGSLVKAVLLDDAQELLGIQNGSRIESTSPYDNSQGMGRINLLSSLPLLNENDFNTVVVNGKEITYGATESKTFHINKVGCARADISATLVWYDTGGAVGCNRCLLNDLNLLVEQISPDGTVIHTNHPNGLSSPDNKNTVERVRITVEHGDVYHVSVKAFNLITPSHKYSLVISGCISSA